MIGDASNYTIEKVRRISNLYREGMFALAVVELAQAAQTDSVMYESILHDLHSYIPKGGILELQETVDVVIQ